MRMIFAFTKIGQLEKTVEGTDGERSIHMLKDYLEKLREDGFVIGFKYNHEALYLLVRLYKDGKTVNCIIDQCDLTDEDVVVEKIQAELKNF